LKKIFSRHFFTLDSL